VNKLLLIVLFSLMLFGCSSSTELDLSSKKAFEESSKQMYNELDSDEAKKEFKEALGYIFMKILNAELRSLAGKDDGSKAELESYHGLTADEVVEKIKQKTDK